jgi:hypothetical protein
MVIRDVSDLMSYLKAVRRNRTARTTTMNKAT